MDGPLDEFPVVLELPVLWGDEDSFAHVNNVAYLRWCETARVEYMRRIGLFPETMPPDGVGPIIASVTCNYRRPLNYPDTVAVGTRVSKIGNTSFRMEQRIVSRATGEVAAESEAVMVVLNYATGETVRVSEEMRAAIARLEEKR